MRRRNINNLITHTTHNPRRDLTAPSSNTNKSKKKRMVETLGLRIAIVRKYPRFKKINLDTPDLLSFPHKFKIKLIGFLFLTGNFPCSSHLILILCSHKWTLWWVILSLDPLSSQWSLTVTCWIQIRIINRARIMPVLTLSFSNSSISLLIILKYLDLPLRSSNLRLLPLTKKKWKWTSVSW